MRRSARPLLALATGLLLVASGGTALRMDDPDPVVAVPTWDVPLAAPADTTVLELSEEPIAPGATPTPVTRESTARRAPTPRPVVEEIHEPTTALAVEVTDDRSGSASPPADPPHVTRPDDDAPAAAASPPSEASDSSPAASEPEPAARGPAAQPEPPADDGPQTLIGRVVAPLGVSCTGFLLRRLCG